MDEDDIVVNFKKKSKKPRKQPELVRNENIKEQKLIQQKMEDIKQEEMLKQTRENTIIVEKKNTVEQIQDMLEGVELEPSVKVDTLAKDNSLIKKDESCDDELCDEEYYFM